MFLYTAVGFEGTPALCDEGVLEWVPKEEIDRLYLWEGDRIFFQLLKDEAPFFSLKLRYEDERLAEAALDGRPMELLDVLDETGEPSGLVRSGRSSIFGAITIGRSISGLRENGRTAVMISFCRSAAAGRIRFPAAMTPPAPDMCGRAAAFWSRL